MTKKVNNILIKCFRACIVYLKLFGGQTSKNDQHVRKLFFRRTSVFLCAFLCFMYCLGSKMIGNDINFYMSILRFEMYGHDSPRTSQRVHEEEPKAGSVQSTLMK